ncbi:MAG: tetratricopeptide repeat protein [Endomicrobium sp.]|jgi:tetratricopeptide (TPR) repeat protein|nr:tetratricopeptide repeat protein [Endomicrobium sp.]
MFQKKTDKNLKYSIIITACFVLVSAGIYFTKNLNYSRDVILQKANSYYINEQYFMAAKYFDKAICLGASSIELYRDYGTSLLNLGNYDLAIKYFKLVINLEPNDFENYYCIGNVLYHKAYVSNSKEKFLQAVQYLEKGINLNPESEKIYLLIGLCFRSCSLQENARTFYRQALLVGNFSRAGFYNLIGNTFREEGKYKEALSSYEKAINDDHLFVAAYCSVGDMYLKLDNDKAALLNYHKAIKIDKDFINPYINIAKLYYDRNSFHEAKSWCLKALEINSNNEKANYILAMSYKAMSMKEEYVEYLKKAAACGSDNAVYEIRNNGINEVDMSYIIRKQ